MKLEQQYQEIMKLKDELDHRLAGGSSFAEITDLALCLSRDQRYLRLYPTDNQLSMLLHFLKIWQEEKRSLPPLGITESIFYQVGSLEELERKYRRIEYYGLRIENGVPEPYCRELMDELLSQKVSGLAFGMILKNRTENVPENLLAVAQELKRRLELPNAVLLLQFARREYPGEEALLLEEADCWLQGQQFERAYALLLEIENPSPEIRELIDELQQVTPHDK